MEQRVSATEGSLPALIIAPHGADDDFTAELAEEIAKEIDCYAVINHGWERAEKFDYYKDHANCNNVNHLQEEVISDEFLEPIQKYVNRILNNSPEAFIYLIHGCGNDTRKRVDDTLDMIVGYGGAKNPKHSSYSSDIWRAHALGYLTFAQGFNTYLSKEGGRFAGNSKNNLNQYYRKHNFNSHVHSLQIEIVKERRKDKDIAKFTGTVIAMAIEDHVDFMTECVGDQGEYVLPIDWDSDWLTIAQKLPKY